MDPVDGARITLRLVRVGQERVEYGVVVHHGDAESTSTASVELPTGTCRLGQWQPEAPPEWATQLACAVLRAEWRQRKDGGGPPWPRRLSRWRASRD